MILCTAADSIDFFAGCSDLYFAAGQACRVREACAGAVDALVVSCATVLAESLRVVEGFGEFLSDRAGNNVVDALRAFRILRVESCGCAGGILASCAFYERLSLRIASGHALRVRSASSADGALVGIDAALCVRALGITG